MTRSRSRLAALAAVVAVTLALAGCAGSGAASSTTASSDGFPVTISDALGGATIASAPERVVTWGWGATEAALALGTVPVAVASMDYGGGDDKLTPWVEKALTDLGAATPTVLDSSAQTVPIEAVLATNPDLFLAPYSGITQDERDALVKAGVKVVAYPDHAWSTPWRDVISIVGKALGKAAAANTLLANLDKLVADTAAAHPEFQGTSIAYVDDDVNTFYMYVDADPRVEILRDLGFTSTPSLDALDPKDGTFYTTVSYEQLDKVDAQVILIQGEQQADLDTFLQSSRGQLIPAVAKGAVAEVVGEENVAAVSPTALSLPWLLPTLAEKLSAAVKTAKG